ncbi:hypothetical protein KJ652_05570 [Patescibacteria group bacterium]|nr:hypothetical protein [Patescibacteria group bacterium]MBU1124030.1 hypothetical protein [Patescibacteria group bacterium]MBU1911281.1 hypothetical protein [Patescibacteria group bacterium]
MKKILSAIIASLFLYLSAPVNLVSAYFFEDIYGPLPVVDNYDEDWPSWVGRLNKGSYQFYGERTPAFVPKVSEKKFVEGWPDWIGKL